MDPFIPSTWYAFHAVRQQASLVFAASHPDPLPRSSRTHANRRSIEHWNLTFNAEDFKPRSSLKDSNLSNENDSGFPQHRFCNLVCGGQALQKLLSFEGLRAFIE